MTIIECLDLKAILDNETDPVRRKELEEKWQTECSVYGTMEFRKPRSAQKS